MSVIEEKVGILNPEVEVDYQAMQRGLMNVFEAINESKLSPEEACNVVLNAFLHVMLHQEETLENVVKVVVSAYREMKCEGVH